MTRGVSFTPSLDDGVSQPNPLTALVEVTRNDREKGSTRLSVRLWLGWLVRTSQVGGAIVAWFQMEGAVHLFCKTFPSPNQLQNWITVRMCPLLANHCMLDICTLHQQEGKCIYFTGHLFINHPIVCWTQRYAFVLQNQYLCKYGGAIFVIYIIIDM